MRIPILLFFFTLITLQVSAQTLIPFEFTSEEDNRLIKENDSLKYYAATGDTSYTVSLNEETSTYRLLTKDRRMIAQGTFVVEGDKYLQDGKWIERFDNGHTKFTGYYQHGKPVGTWEEYYDNGKIKAISNYAIIKDDIGSLKSCLSGSYQEYYKTGRLKTVGFYAAVPQSVSETVKVQDPVSGVTKEVVTKSVTYQPEKVGHWEQYDENGETEKKED